jgi:hypothetical protein
MLHKTPVGKTCLVQLRRGKQDNVALHASRPMGVREGPYTVELMRGGDEPCLHSCFMPMLTHCMSVYLCIPHSTNACYVG